MSVLQHLLAFILAISVLIVVHELGHYLVARWCGVKVLCFSLGFGPRLIGRKLGPDSTEFVLSAIPLGGFVRMLDEREGHVPVNERARAFNVQSLLKRSLIVAAGPLANFLLAVVVYWFLACLGERTYPAQLGEVPQSSAAAQAGLQKGDTIVAINNSPVHSWEQLRWEIMQLALDERQIDVKVMRKESSPRAYQLHLSKFDFDNSTQDPLALAGLRPSIIEIKPLLAEPLSGSPAAKTGLKTGDLILSVNNSPVNNWSEFVETVSNSSGKTLGLEILRDKQILVFDVTPEPSPDHPNKGRIGVGVQLEDDFREKNTVISRYGFLAGLGVGIERTLSTTLFSMKLMLRILTGEVSVRNISGPITIADYAGQSASAGPESFLKFLALISISIGMLNLLPVPILDGGHLLYYALEWVRGAPLSDHAQEIGQRIGVAALMLLMMLAFYNDLNRIFFG